MLKNAHCQRLGVTAKHWSTPKASCSWPRASSNHYSFVRTSGTDDEKITFLMIFKHFHHFQTCKLMQKHEFTRRNTQQWTNQSLVPISCLRLICADRRE